MAKAKKIEAKKEVTSKSKKAKVTDKPVVLVAWSKVKKTVELRVSREVKFALTDFLAKLMKNAEELAQSDGMQTIKGKHIEAAINAKSSATPSAEEER